MKSVKRFSLMMTLIVVTLAMLMGSVIAAGETMDVSLVPAQNKVEKGKEVTVSVNIANVNVPSSTGDGVNAFKATLTYDTDVFESVTIDGANDWVKQTYNTANGIFILTYSNLLTEKSGTIAKLTFKVKEDTTKTTGSISLTNIESSNTETKVTPANATTTLNINQTTPDDGNNTASNNTAGGNNSTGNQNTTGGQNQVTNTTGNQSSGGQATTNKAGNSTGVNTANKNLPKTGIGQWSIIAGLVIIIVAIVSYLKYRKYNGIK